MDKMVQVTHIFMPGNLVMQFKNIYIFVLSNYVLPIVVTNLYPNCTCSFLSSEYTEYQGSFFCSVLKNDGGSAPKMFCHYGSL